jgi:DNA polymerase III gamma/tau subunit
MGPTGSGKTTIHQIYLKALLCENKDKDGNPCNTCQHCLTVEKGINTEYLYLFDGGSFGVTEADLVIDKTFKKILGAKNQKKIFVIDEFQSIKSREAEEKLLKIFEREWDNCYFVLSAMRWDKLNKALKNRSVSYTIMLHSEEILNYINYIAEQEKSNIKNLDKVKLLFPAIANVSNGSMRQAISYLERIIYSEIETPEELVKELNILVDAEVNMIVNNLMKGNINVLKAQLTEDTLEQIEKKLLLMYEYSAGLKLNEWEINQLSGIDKFDIYSIKSTLAGLNELRKFPYKDQHLIKVTMTNLILENRSTYKHVEQTIERKPREVK